MKKKFVALSVLFLVALSFLLISTPLSAQEKVIKLRYSNLFPPVHPFAKMADEWCKEVEKRTNGRVTVTHFPGNTLTPPTQTYDSVVKGIADVGQSLMAYSAGRFPLTGVFGLPLGFTSGAQATKTLNAFYQKFHPKEFDDTKVMYLHGHGPGLISTKKVLGSIDDIKGLRIKVNAENADIISALGGAPVTMPITETYDALQKGLIEGVLLPFEALKGWKFGEIVKTTIVNHSMSYTAPIFIVMNKDKWNSISKADQQAIEKINEEWIEKQAQMWNKLDKEAEEFVIAKGVKVLRASKADEAKVAEKMKPIFPEFVKDMKAKGLNGEEVLKFCLDYIKTHP
ncbi:MAG: TRAP transporter substrate-binding protein [Deltaproteobacteria bacterium]|nr:TRAP transporter substrate-binding protein [Deltaproteobacteria bacterium]